MHFKFKLGADISKGWIDFCMLNENFEVVIKARIDNNCESIQLFIDELIETDEVNSIDQIILIIEHTGLYNNHLIRTWMSSSGQLSLVQANKISEALQGTYSFEEKTDDMDAHRIAEYACRFSDKLKLHHLRTTSLVSLKLLRAQRNRFVKTINLLEVPVKEIQNFELEEHSNMVYNLQDNAINALKQALANIEKEIMRIINQDANLKNLFKIMCSVVGIGKVTACEILITTNGFTDFAPNQAKSYSRFCGVVPLPKSSGKIKRKLRISKRSNAKMKSLLTICALSLINTKSDLGLYYERKKKSGKEHMSIINAMRNKLILRVFAVVRNQTMYERNMNILLD